MGMSASQARLLSLQARQSNLEYQGQQINQERTILSQQCTALYNSLLEMNVPTPPSTNDYTTIKYSGTDGATTFALGTVKPSGELYNVEIQQSATGAAITTNYGSSVVGKAGADISVNPVQPTSVQGTGIYGQLNDGTEYQDGDIYIDETPVSGQTLIDGKEDVSNYMELTAEGYKPVEKFEAGKNYYKKSSKEDFEAAEDQSKYSHLRENTEEVSLKLKSSDLSSYYVRTSSGDVAALYEGSPYVEPNEDGTFSLKTLEGVEYFQKANGGTTTITNPNDGATTIAGQTAYDFNTAANMEEFSSFDWEKYREAIRNSYGSSDSSITEDDFYVFLVTSETGTKTLQFALKSDVDSPDGFADTFSYTPNGKYTTSTPTDKCQLEFDTQGRITKIGIPTVDSTTGEIISYRYIDLKAETVTDNAAYQDAYNQYEYAQYEYDKKQQEINAKTSIIQQEDRNLELKLQRLDNERTQITTEIEAVDKVINDNIEASYKTFSG